MLGDEGLEDIKDLLLLAAWELGNGFKHLSCPPVGLGSCGAAGLQRPGSCHLLRHTCATHMLNGGADIRFIQQLLGHEKLETTAIYTEVTITQLQLVHERCHPASHLPEEPAETDPAKTEAEPPADAAADSV